MGLNVEHRLVQSLKLNHHVRSRKAGPVVAISISLNCWTCASSVNFSYVSIGITKQGAASIILYNASPYIAYAILTLDLKRQVPGVARGWLAWTKSCLYSSKRVYDNDSQCLWSCLRLSRSRTESSCRHILSVEDRGTDPFLERLAFDAIYLAAYLGRLVMSYNH